MPDPSLELTVPGGTNEITAGDPRPGEPRRSRLPVPDRGRAALARLRACWLNESQVSVPRGGTAAVGVTVKRKGYSGPITVTVADPPAGLTVRPGTIAAGQTAVCSRSPAAADASFPAAPSSLSAAAKGTNGPFERLAFKQVVYAQQSNLPMCSDRPLRPGRGPALALPVTLETPSTPIEVAHGFSATIPVKVARTKGADAALAITAFRLPAGPDCRRCNDRRESH